MDMIDISKMDKVEVLMALYNNAKHQGMGRMGKIHFAHKPLRKDEAEAFLEDQTSFDYLRGRVMKVDLSGDELSVDLYDRDNGPGAAEKALSDLIS